MPSKQPLNIGDSIGLAALILTAVTATVTLPIWIKAVVLGAVFPMVFIATNRSQWTNQLPRSFKLTISFALSSLLLWIAVDAFSLHLHQTYGYGIVELVVRVTFACLQTLHRKHVRDVLLFAAGSACGLAVSMLVTWIKSVRKKRQDCEDLGKPKGFLEYRIQAESAMHSLGPAISTITPLSSKMTEVMVNHLTEVGSAGGSNPQKLLKIFRMTAKRMDAITSELVRRTIQLAKVSDNLEEGTMGWFTWASGSEASRAEFEAILPSFTGLQSAIRTGISSIEKLASLMSAYKGATGALDAALDRYFAALSQINLINKRIDLMLDRSINLLSGSDQQRQSTQD